MHVHRLDHVGVEAAADHDQEDATAGAAGIAAGNGPFLHDPAALLRSRAKVEVPGQQVLVPGGKHGQRQPRNGAIDQFGGRAVAAHGDQGPQAALGEPSIGLAGDFVQIRENCDIETLLAKELDQVRNPILGGPCPRLRVDRHDDVSEFFR